MSPVMEGIVAERRRKRSTSRQRGRPPRSVAAMTPASLHEVGRQILSGRSIVAVAASFGTDESTIRYHLERTIKPAWREGMDEALDLSIEVARVDEIERVAYERFFRSCRPSSSVADKD